MCHCFSFAFSKMTSCLRKRGRDFLCSGGVQRLLSVIVELSWNQFKNPNA